MSQQSQTQQLDKSASIVKSGFLWKKGSGVLGKNYKERLFELKLTGKVDYYEVSKDGQKTLKGTIHLSSGTSIKRRTDVPSDQHKFMIKTKQREWYLWCKGHDSKQQVDEWCTLLNDMIHSSNTKNSKPMNKSTCIGPNNDSTQSTNMNIIDEKQESNDILRPTATKEIENVSPNPIDSTDHLDPSDMLNKDLKSTTDSEDLFGDYITPQDILKSRPINPNQPFNPFYGGHVSAAATAPPEPQYQSQSSTKPLPESPNSNNHNNTQYNPYYAQLKPIHSNPINKKMPIQQIQPNNNISHNRNFSSASAPSFEDSKLNEQFQSMDLQQLNSGDIQFKIGPTVSLKSILFKSWVSFNKESGLLCATQTAPMVDERFTFYCIDPLNNVYTIQTSNGLYISADNGGGLKFLQKVYGIYEQWIVKYYHINKISITSKYYNTHFGIDANGLYHHRYPSITDIVKFEVSPPVNLTQTQQNKAIAITHWQESHSKPPSHQTNIPWPMLMTGQSIALSSCVSDGNHIGVENKSSKHVTTNYNTYQSFDGEILTRSSFMIHQDKPYQLFAFKSALNGKYLSPEDIRNGKIRFSDNLTEKEYFQVIWHDVNIISLVTYHGTVLKINQKDNTLYHEGYDWRSPHCAFEIKSKQFDRLNNVNSKKKTISNMHASSLPHPQLPVRTINGQIKRDIWLKGNGDMGYLAFRSKPYRYEAVSRIMGRWETLRFQHDIKRNNSDKCIVSLFTENGMILACDHVAQLTFLTKDDENDELRCRWRIYFHNYSLISIQNEKYKGWLILKKHIKTSIYVLTIINPQFDTHGQPIVTIENARKFKNRNCQFQLCPIANCKDLQYKQNGAMNHKKNMSTTNVSFAM